MGEFNSDDHYIYYCGQESLRRNGVAIIVNKSPKFCTWMQSQKRQNDLICFQGKPFSITVIQVCAPTSNTEEAEGEQFYSSVGKESTCSAGDPSSIPGSGRSPGEGKGYPLQCCCLENPRDWGAWWAAIYGVTQSRTRLKGLSSSSSSQEQGSLF